MSVRFHQQLLFKGILTGTIKFPLTIDMLLYGVEIYALKKYLRKDLGLDPESFCYELCDFPNMCRNITGIVIKIVE